MRPLLLALALALLPSPALAERLPDDVRPLRYRLHFEPDLAAERFEGTAEIDVVVVTPTRVVVLNAVDLEVHESSLDQDGRRQEATREMDPAREQVRLTVARPLAPGPAVLRLRFGAPLRRQLAGFYLSTTPQRKYAFTQLWATNARRMFPCFDEPALKATFDVSVTIASGDRAISNAPQRSDEPGLQPGTHVVRFAPSPKMSTYLVALAVGDFECREGTAAGVPIRVCATPGKQAFTGHALAAAEASLPFYNRYFGIPYPYDKLDLIAAPDFWVGAMENAGAIMFREEELLIDPAHTSERRLASTARVVAHEIAHQWFGDLVTARWWDDAWLSEGFATFMATKPVNDWRPAWQEFGEEAQEAIQALSVDSRAHPRAIRTNTESPAEIPQLFDGVIYQKAASILRMLERFVGPEAFRRGVHLFLTRHAWGTATSEDFARALADGSGQNVGPVLASFVDQAGAPLVDVDVVCEGDRHRITLRQRRFSPQEADDARWQLPVCWRTPDRKECSLLTGAEQQFTSTGCPAWTFVNADGQGYYRTRYSAASAGVLAAHFADLTSAEQALLLADSWALVGAGLADVPQVLRLTQAASAEDLRLVVARQVYPPLAAVDDLVAEADRASFRAWVRRLIEPALHRLGIEAASDEAPDRRALRAIVLATAADAAQIDSVRGSLRRTAHQYMAGESISADPDVVDVALRVLAEDEGPDVYDSFKAAERRAADPAERLRYLHARAQVRDPRLLRRTLDDLLSPEVRGQDAPWVLLTAAGRAESRPLVWAFVAANFDRIRATFGDGQGAPLARLVGLTCEADLLARMRQFLGARSLPGLERPLGEAYERAAGCVAFRAREQPLLHEWLAH